MATVLITGGAGYIGSHCAKAVAEAGHHPVVYDDFSTGHRDFVRWGPLVEADIRDAEALKRVFASYKPDIVMHFAAKSLVGESVAQPQLYHDVNVGGCLALLNAMRDAGTDKLVFSSSAAVYGEATEVPIAENAPLIPTNPYGETKLACERLLGEFRTAHQIQSVALRYFNAAGADSSGEIGEFHENETHLIPLVLDAALGRRDFIGIFGDDYPTPDGTAIRDYIHVSDLASGHMAALDHLMRGGDSEIFNLGTGNGISVREIIDMVVRVTGRSVNARIAPRREGDPTALVADPARARQNLNWQPVRSDVKNIVADAWRWHKARFGAA